MPRTIAFRAPTRIDFGGGWTDVPPYSDREGGFVCNIAITRYATVRLTAQRDPTAPCSVITDRPGDQSLVEAALRRAAPRGIELALHNDFPVGAGLGGSSAAGVAVAAALAAWNNERLSRRELAERSRDLEISDLGIAGGRQDHYAAVHGGALALRFDSDVTVEAIPLSPVAAAALERQCLLVYTGQARISGETITAVLDAYEARDQRVLLALARMRTLAEQMSHVLAGGDIDSLGSLVDEHWDMQRNLHPAITTPLIDAIIERARLAGALGSKALGASGGGCVLVVAASDRIAEVTAAVASCGTMLSFTIDTNGVSECP